MTRGRESAVQLGGGRESRAGSPYRAYMYAYPHKTAYRSIEPVSIRDVWRHEDRTALFAYAHVPLCEMRCGFCNLFTMARPPEELAERFVERIVEQIRGTAEAIGPSSFARMAIGGGTPTVLTPDQLTRLFSALRDVGADPHHIPCSIETSPKTATPDRLEVLSGHGVERVSIGVQTFGDAESKRLARPQAVAEVRRALSAIQASGIPEWNIDLIYGIEGQTRETFERSIREAVDHGAAEIFLYPLYVRELTGLGLSGRRWDDQRLDLYRHGRDVLLDAGYRQLSMRVFRREAERDDAPDYSCQDDGMLGFGIGARSYTSTLHYSEDYAVSRTAVAGLIDRWLAEPAETRLQVTHGFRLDDMECRRRYVIKSILRTHGLDRGRYEHRFGDDPLDAHEELGVFIERGWLSQHGAVLVPTSTGLEWSDHMGPAMISPEVAALSEEYELR